MSGVYQLRQLLLKDLSWLVHDCWGGGSTPPPPNFLQKIPQPCRKELFRWNFQERSVLIPRIWEKYGKIPHYHRFSKFCENQWYWSFSDVARRNSDFFRSKMGSLYCRDPFSPTKIYFSAKFFFNRKDNDPIYNLSYIFQDFLHFVNLPAHVLWRVQIVIMTKTCHILHARYKKFASSIAK